MIIYIHIDLPGHSQYFGVCLPNETDLYLGSLAIANQEIRQEVKTITMNYPEAIIIVAGDH